MFSSAAIRSYLDRAAATAGLVDNDGSRLRITPHDFRRLFLTDLVGSGFPIHIAAQLAGHEDLNTTRRYTAVYPQEVFEHYQVVPGPPPRGTTRRGVPDTYRRETHRVR